MSALLLFITDNGAIVNALCVYFVCVCVFSLKLLARIILGYLGECHPPNAPGLYGRFR